MVSVLTSIFSFKVSPFKQNTQIKTKIKQVEKKNCLPQPKKKKKGRK